MRTAEAAMVMTVSATPVSCSLVADETPVPEDPGGGALEHPAARQHLERFGARAAADDLKRDVGVIGGAAYEATGIAASGEDAGDEGEALPGCPER